MDAEQIGVGTSCGLMGQRSSHLQVSDGLQHLRWPAQARLHASMQIAGACLCTASVVLLTPFQLVGQASTDALLIDHRLEATAPNAWHTLCRYGHEAAKV